MQRIIPIIGTLDDSSGAPTISQLYALNRASTTKPIHVLIDSGGGSLSTGLALYNLFLASKAPIYTYNLSSAFSAGLIIYLSGIKRFAFPTSSFLAHPPKFSTSNEYSLPDELRSSGDFGHQRQKTLAHIVYLSGKLTKRKAVSLVSKDSYFNVDSAIKYGMVDHVIDKFPTDRMLEDDCSDEESDKPSKAKSKKQPTKKSKSK